MTTYRPFHPTDLLKFNNVNLDSLTETYGFNFYLYYLVNWPEFYQVAQHPNGEIMGYVMGKTEGKGEEWHGHVTALSVSPSFRRIGLGAAMMKNLETISEIKSSFFVDLFVRVSNTVAINMYKSLGYVVYREIKDYYSGPVDEDAYVSYHMRENGPIRLVYTLFLATEFIVVVFAFVISGICLYLLRNTAFIHYNMKLITSSYLLTTMLIATLRCMWCISEILLVSEELMEYIMVVRSLAMGAISSHLWVMSVERFVATKRIKLYEHSSNTILVIVILIFAYAVGLGQMYAKYNSSYGREISVFVSTTLAILSTTIMIYVLIKNKKLLADVRCTMDRSQCYQIRENLKTSRMLYKCFLFGIAMTITTSVILLQFFGFLYDILTAITLCAIPLLIVFSEDSDLKRRAVAFICLFRNQSEGKVKSLMKDTEGRTIKLATDGANDGKVYFEQLQQAWQRY